jgi:allophanate hydrolase subunit 1
LRVSSLNRSTVLVELADLDAVLALHATLVDAPFAGIREIVPAARTLMLRFDPAHWSRHTLTAALAQRDLSVAMSDRGPLIEIPMRYDGEDLAEIAQLCGLSIEEVIRRHGAREYTVAFCGFSPGSAISSAATRFCRCRADRPRVRACLQARWRWAACIAAFIRRRAPAAGTSSARRRCRCADVERTTPAILTPGTRVKFVERDSGPAVEITAKEKSLVEPYLNVTSATLPALVRGPRSARSRGDRRAPPRVRSIEALCGQPMPSVGNSLKLAALENHFGNFAFEIFGAAEIALAGATVPITVTRASGEVFEAAMQNADRSASR